MLAVITVNTLIDELDGRIDDGDISLRDAVNAAFADDTIKFSSTVQGMNGGTINLTLGQIEFGKSLTIDASALPAGITIRGNDPDRGQPGEVLGNGSRIFDITDPTNGVSPPLVTLIGLRLTGGDPGQLFQGDLFFPKEGGAIRSAGRLVLQNCTIEGNYASEGGGIYIVTPGGQSSLVKTLIIENSTIRNNRAVTLSGGGVYWILADASQTMGSVEVIHSAIIGNESVSGGGGLSIYFGPESIENATTQSKLLVDRSTIADNTSDGRGGGMFINGGSGNEWILRDSTVSGNGKQGATVHTTYGGGVYALFRAWEYYTDNKPRFTITGCTFEDNAALNAGGGVFMCAKANGEFVVLNSTFSGNLVQNPGGMGGGIVVAVYESNRFGRPNDIDVYIHNSTITGNFASLGGGVYSKHNFPPGSTEHQLNTHIRNTIISENYQTTAQNSPRSNLYGRIVAAELKNNLLGNANTSQLFDATTGNALTAPQIDAINAANRMNDNAPDLGLLHFNGGFTKTRRPNATSVHVIDRGDNMHAVDPFGSFPTAGTLEPVQLPTDQRGVPRIYNVPNVNDPGDKVDIGAFEVTTPRVMNVIIGSTINPGGLNLPYAFNETNYHPNNTALHNKPRVGDGFQLRTVPVGTANQISVQFSDYVDVDMNSLEFIALNRVVTEPSISSFATEGPSATKAFTATWTLSGEFNGALPSAQYLLRIKDTVTDAGGVALDGEWVNPANWNTTTATSTFPSGNNVPGGDFNFVFTILRADGSRNNWVDNADFNLISFHFNKPGVWSFTSGDFSGDGAVANADFNLLSFEYNLNFQTFRVLGDYDGDFLLDGSDQSDFAQYYSTNDLRADLDGDGTVNSADQLAFNALVAFNVQFSYVS